MKILLTRVWLKGLLSSSQAHQLDSFLHFVRMVKRLQLEVKHDYGKNHTSRKSEECREIIANLSKILTFVLFYFPFLCINNTGTVEALIGSYVSVSIGGQNPGACQSTHNFMLLHVHISHTCTYT